MTTQLNFTPINANTELTEFPQRMATQLQRTVDELRCCADDLEAIATLTRCLCRVVLLFPEQCSMALIAGVTFKATADLAQTI